MAGRLVDLPPLMPLPIETGVYSISKSWGATGAVPSNLSNIQEMTVLVITFALTALEGPFYHQLPESSARLSARLLWQRLLCISWLNPLFLLIAAEPSISAHHQCCKEGDALHFICTSVKLFTSFSKTSGWLPRPLQTLFLPILFLSHRMEIIPYALPAI